MTHASTPNSSRILLSGGRLLSPADGLDATGDVLVQDGRIVALGADVDATSIDHRIDVDGLLVCPGLVDPHVHLCEPGQAAKETIATGTAAGRSSGKVASSATCSSRCMRTSWGPSRATVR